MSESKAEETIEIKVEKPQNASEDIDAETDSKNEIEEVQEVVVSEDNKDNTKENLDK